MHEDRSQFQMAVETVNALKGQNFGGVGKGNRGWHALLGDVYSTGYEVIPALSYR